MPLSTSRLPPTVSLGPAPGAYLICTFLGLISYGIALHQIYRYTRIHSSDPYIIKCYVVILGVLDMFHTVLAVHLNYRHLVTDYFQPTNLSQPVWSLSVQPLVIGVILVVCQIFFAARVYLLSKKYRIIVALVCILSLAILGCSTAFTVKGFTVDDVNDLNHYASLQSAGFGATIAADVMLTSVLILALHRSRTGFTQTDSKIDVLIAYAISTGLIPVIFAAVCFITAIADPGNLLFGALDFVCTKIYVNSVLAALNLRQSLKADEGSGRDAGGMNLSVLQRRSRVVNVVSSSGASTDAGSSVIDIKMGGEIRLGG
ncbi:hypothetical protein OH77DRAFT_1426904 [Trametes cingulata]|nr:hypothetical protein OH77DRAFT_1426904 [Trametes cingulata]